MPQPVKLSDRLVVDARNVGEIVERSIAGQIEFWATLGKALEQVMGFSDVVALRRAGAARTLSEMIDDVSTKAGRERLASVLQALPFPHFEPTGEKGVFVRIGEDGSRVTGRFARKTFVALKPAAHVRARR